MSWALNRIPAVRTCPPRCFTDATGIGAPHRHGLPTVKFLPEESDRCPEGGRDARQPEDRVGRGHEVETCVGSAGWQGWSGY